MSTVTDRDTALLARLRQHDEHALAEIVLAYRDPLSRYVARLLHRSDDVEDILQHVFFRLWSTRESLAITTSLRAYLYTAARNHALNHARDHRADRHLVPLLPQSATVPAPSADYDAEALRIAVYAAIDALPERCREVFLLSRDGGLSYPEIATALGISINTVKTQMSRALGVLARAAAPFAGMVLLAVT